MPKFTFMGWKWATVSSLMYRARAPMAVSWESRWGFLQPAGQFQGRQAAGGGGLHVPLHPGDLAGKDDAGLCLHPVVPVQQPGESR